MNGNGKFIISLDFELIWGVRDTDGYENYYNNILGVWEVIPKVLNLFNEYNIRATWATVGFLFASTQEELSKYFPLVKPNYSNKNLSPYNNFYKNSFKNNKLFFAPELINLIKSYSRQEIATHTFSHYYCLESGQVKEEFEQDIIAACNMAENVNIQFKSLVFPRNQFNKDYLKIIEQYGITSYRGNEKIWFHNASKSDNQTLTRRAFRLLDTYFSISGNNCYSKNELINNTPYNIPASRFLRPYTPKLKLLENLRFQRISKSMTYAARNGEVYHLWWHPHNFGVHQEENLSFLKKVLEHYRKLNIKYNFESNSMQELANNLDQIKHYE